ncbi:phosphopantetheine-binding protein [Rhodococcus sp. HNM0569]|uniref:phosphopantetheine-binding protein n=1 Tax=Rhodococcus sp. HNM0569 TaxID=2716340 RepID=UPI00146C037C|nr:phosphopantetheine-binding protein [Rhodococcus sp. HNM0569]NLU84586.1 isochorismatase [Rhodococcus sp. HNM0569]
MPDQAVPDLEQIHSDVAEVLGLPVAELDADANLLDEGLDSVRVMSLIERWRAAGADVDLVDLVAEPTVTRWSEVVAGR